MDKFYKSGIVAMILVMLNLTSFGLAIVDFDIFSYILTCLTTVVTLAYVWVGAYRMMEYIEEAEENDKD